MSGLLDLVLSAHGGAVRWSRVKSIEVSLEITGALLEIKGFPAPLLTTISVSADWPKVVMQPYGGTHCRGIFTPQRVWVEALGGDILGDRENPRAAFSGHVRETPWDELHRLYFLGYAMWNYLCSPFLLSGQGFATKELEEHREGGEVWRVMEVHYPDDIPTHCNTQLFYFDKSGLIKRIDYVTDVAGGIASHYCFDHKDFDGLVIPTRRRVVRRSPDGPLLFGPTAVFLDYKAVKIRNK